MHETVKEDLLKEDSLLATSVWSAMLAGNRKFAEGSLNCHGLSEETRLSLIEGQHPGAVVLSCADSRVAPEFVFGAGLGDIFSVRTAGEVLDDAVIASLEYAVSDLGVKVLVVLGHEHCGAVQAVLPNVQKLVSKYGEDEANEIIESSESILLRSLGPAALAGIEEDLSTDDIERIHVSNMLTEICDKSQIIREAAFNDNLMLVGARYRMSDGLVEVLSC
ncbi:MULTISPECIES: carbonic anhydrase [Gardnerella]|uniref:carbonic anhydrase n=1 Tax=Gardnerella TaxID=2701 RepID=UPI0007E3DF15|nr:MULTISPECIES: carbonic anhydrase [unclassified Gardnerella]MDK6295857.1 carbonic anhydrase [Gardnerella swidsinskii]PMC50539.1 carbonate dehydratase [Gardnerella vaginalis]RFT32768.1 carbonate dehydratase [Bifidobacteriaceae bacterium NR020]MDK7093356.1 carbonic anhydrase [Gardnerella swidsinskii]PMC54400.1 carbonate dehydratase [Gardnerella vaginalis]